MADLLPDRHGLPRYKFRIQRIGVEIEGAWKVKPNTVDPATGRPMPTPLFTDHCEIKGDPSVKNFTATGIAAIGEVVSEPLIRPALWLWIRNHYPDVTNRTCGIHVHMSLRHELDYQRLIDRRFHDHMLVGLHTWGLQQKLPRDHELWKRLRGCNLFCQDVFHGDLQTRFGGDHERGGREFHDFRYGLINYCWAQHKTFEVRVLPTFADRRTAIRAIRRVLNLTEEWLAHARQVKEVEQSIVVRTSDLVPTAAGIPIRVAVDVVDRDLHEPPYYESYKVIPQDSRWYSLATMTEGDAVIRGIFHTDVAAPAHAKPAQRPSFRDYVMGTDPVTAFQYIQWDQETIARPQPTPLTDQAARTFTERLRQAGHRPAAVKFRP